jgi:hypothetical protein
MAEPKRITVEVATELHSKIKQHAARRNISIRKMLTRWIMEKIKKEESYLKPPGGK